MSRLQCSGKQLLLDVSYTDQADGKRASDTDKASGLHRNLPAHDLPHSVQQSGSKTDKVAFVEEPSSAALSNLAQGHGLGDECQTGPKSNEPLLLSSLGNIYEHKHGEHAVEADPDHGLSLEDLGKTQPSDSGTTGEKIHSPLSMPVHQPTEQHADEEDEDEDHKAPLELMAEFLTAVMCNNFKVARSLCQMILIYEPENAEAKLFLPLIQLKLQDDGNDEDGSDSSEDDDGTGDSGSDEESPQNTSSSSSSLSTSSSSSEDDEEKD